MVWVLSLISSGLAAQFQSNFYEQQLMFGEMVESDYLYQLSRYSQPKALTILLPSTSVSLISPELKYGDMYNANRKSLDLVAANDSGKNFNLHVNARMSYGGLRYQLNKFNVSLMHEWTSDATLFLPHHLFEAATKGNTQLANSTLVINPSAVMLNAHKWSLGLDYSFERFMAGFQFHMIRGDSYFNTNSSSVNINMEDHFFELSLDKNINVKSSGTIEYHAIDSIEVLLNDNAFSVLGSSKNTGFGISAHLKYLVNDQLTVFGRIEDLGYVKWKNESHTLTDESQSEFSGFDIRESYVSGEAYSIEDTIHGLISIVDQKTPFKSSLNHSLMVGFQYGLNDFLSIGGIARVKNNGLHQMLFMETMATVQPFDQTFITVGNIFYKTAPINFKMMLRTEISQTIGINLNLINPWRFGKYYDTKIIHASFGLYLKLL